MLCDVSLGLGGAAFLAFVVVWREEVEAKSHALRW
jgi:hypothetical protein